MSIHNYESMIDHMVAAKQAAIKENIIANAVIIATDVARSYLPDFANTPVILGMRSYYTNELPDNVEFIIADDHKGFVKSYNDLQAENDALIARVAMLEGAISNAAEVIGL